MVIELAADKVYPLAELNMPASVNSTMTTERVKLALPVTPAVPGEIRLTLYDGDREIGRNGYAVTLHPMAEATKHIAGARPLALLASHAGTELILRELGVPFKTTASDVIPDDLKIAIIPPTIDAGKINSRALRSWIESGGRLLILEQGLGSIPGVGEYTVSSALNSFVDLAIPAHPIFSGLTPADFDTWAENNNGNLIVRTLLPLNTTALAVKGGFASRKDFGAAVAEARIGKGSVVLSQLKATELWKKNGAATRYLLNLVTYMAGPNPPLYPARPLEQNSRRYSIVSDRAFFVDLSGVANRGFSGDNSWTGQGNNDFRMMPLGEQQTAGIPFKIIDPAANGGKSCLMLRGLHGPEMPTEIRGIPLNAKVSALYFLHTAAWAGRGQCGTYRIRYADGTQADYPLVGETNIDDWWSPGALLPQALPGLTRVNAAGHAVGLFVARWDNPRPGSPV